jgi:hypothetical protein
MELVSEEELGSMELVSGKTSLHWSPFLCAHNAYDELASGVSYF